VRGRNQNQAATAAADRDRGTYSLDADRRTGSMGQVATSLIEQAGRECEIILLGRRVFLLEDRRAVLAGLKAARPDVVINAAAYTAVDQAEAEESVAVAINGEGAGHVAEAADWIGAPLLQLSTDYVFDGALNRPYREDDPPGPRSAYGRSKLLGERLVAERCANSVIVRTAEIKQLWVAETHRGKGLGRSLLGRAIVEASARDCRLVWAMTYDFQAPGLYERCGFERVAELLDWPPGHTHIILRLHLDAL